MNTPSKPEELLEIAEKQAGADAMEMLVDKHLDNLMVLREQMSIEDIDLLSSNIATNKHLDKAVKDRITSLQSKMRALIEEVARRVENQKYRTAEEAIGGLQLSRTQKEKVTALLSADKTIHVSCQSLKVAVDLFFKLNEQILERLKSASSNDPGEERKLLLGNSLLVCELTDFAIRFIDGFQLHGADEIKAIHKEMQRTIGTLREEAKVLRKQAELPDIDVNVKQQVLSNITDRDESIVFLEQEWSSYMQTVQSVEGEITCVTKMLPSLRLIRDNAKAQIKTLAAIAVVQIVKNNIQAIEATVIQLNNIQLASLSTDRVRRLLGIR